MYLIVVRTQSGRLFLEDETLTTEDEDGNEFECEGAMEFKTKLDATQYGEKHLCGIWGVVQSPI